MRLDDAKAEILERISKIIGTKISENDLTFHQKQSLTSIAQIFRQLIVAKRMLMIEQRSRSSFSYSIFKRISKKGEEDELLKISNYIRQIDEIETLLNNKINELANDIIETQQQKLMIERGMQPIRESSVIIQPLQCTNCGGQLRVISYNMAECEYCGMKYTMGSFLSMMRASFEKTKY